MKHQKSENRTQQQKQQPTTVTILMLICRGDTHPNQGFLTKLRPRGLSTHFFVVEKPRTQPRRGRVRGFGTEKKRVDRPRGLNLVKKP